MRQKRNFKHDPDLLWDRQVDILQSHEVDSPRDPVTKYFRSYLKSEGYDTRRQRAISRNWKDQSKRKTQYKT